tara:strand:+ start:35264 stop:37654 length:2391 start_codon:yes stop_codon:yes gene_type:complete
MAENNVKLNIAEGLSVKSKSWKNRKVDWSKLVLKLKTATVTNETLKQYAAASKDERSKIKDVGGFVGGYLLNGRRKPENVLNRQMLTLDIDYGHLDFWIDFKLIFNNAALLHTTHSHTDDSPRFRLLMPLSREVTSDEYVAISRQVAGLIDIELFDNTTFEANRLMFWPSVSSDAKYYCKEQIGPVLDPDWVLKQYSDWTDSTFWPTAEKQLSAVNSLTKKQEDPEDKTGIIGAFCRAYNIETAIENFLSLDYKPAGENRFSYTKGSTSAGLIVYDNKFAFSHHGTDPSSGKLCNSFDLVRLHKFGHLDEGILKRQKSTIKMELFAASCKEVKKLIAKERFDNAFSDFENSAEDIAVDIENDDDDDNLDWIEELELDTKGKYKSTANNINVVLANDKILKGAFKLNSFDNKRYMGRSMPWRLLDCIEPIKNVDYSGIRNYMETVYGIVGNLKIDDSLALEFEKNYFNPIEDYLKDLVWDKVNRVDNLLIDYLGAEKNIYSQEAIRKTLVGAVGRIFEPGIKFDLVLTLVGAQGIGKSTLARKLGKTWFSDTFMTVHGKDAFEQLQGAWIIEMAELSGLRKAEVEAVKHFISKQVDSFRPAYGRVVETYKRQCIFIGTTNNTNFLSDPTGNRRFMPIDVRPDFASKDVFKISEIEVDQIWAEAVDMFNKGEKLYLSKAAASLAKEEQKEHSVQDERQGLIEQYLETTLPKDWSKLDLFERRAYLEDPTESVDNRERQFVCMAEIWCECLGKDKKDMDRYKTREVNSILQNLDLWERTKSTKNFTHYGKQKYYAKKLN